MGNAESCFLCSRLCCGENGFFENSLGGCVFDLGLTDCESKCDAITDTVNAFVNRNCRIIFGELGFLFLRKFIWKVEPMFCTVHAYLVDLQIRFFFR